MKKSFITLAVIALLIPTLCAAQETATQSTDSSTPSNPEITATEKPTTDTTNLTNSEPPEEKPQPAHNPRMVPPDEKAGETQETLSTTTQQKTTKTTTSKKSTQETKKDEDTSSERATTTEKQLQLEPVEIQSFDLNLNTQEKEPLKIHNEESYTQQEIPEDPVKEKIINNQVKIAFITIGGAFGIFLIWATITTLITLIRKRK